MQTLFYSLTFYSLYYLVFYSLCVIKKSLLKRLLFAPVVACLPAGRDLGC